MLIRMHGKMTPGFDRGEGMSVSEIVRSLIDLGNLGEGSAVPAPGAVGAPVRAVVGAVGAIGAGAKATEQLPSTTAGGAIGAPPRRIGGAVGAVGGVDPATAQCGSRTQEETNLRAIRATA